MDNFKHLIPSQLDDAGRFLWWDLDVAMLAMGSFVIGMVIGFPMLSLALGLILAAVYQKSKNGRHKAVGFHMLYWYLGITFGMKKVPPSHLRNFIG